MTKILIAVNPGFHNKGDAAILSGAFETLKTLGNAEISLISYYPEYDSTQCGARIISAVKRPRIARIFNSVFLMHPRPMLFEALSRTFLYRICLEISGFIKREIWEEYYKSDIIMAGLDGTFTTLYGVGGFVLNSYAIFLAKLFKKPVIIYAASIEPFKNKLYEILARFILNKVDLVTLRERKSYQYLRKIGVSKPPIYVTADLGFLLQPASPERVKRIISIEGINKNNEPLIGMTVRRGISRWIFPNLKTSGERYANYVALMAQVVDYLLDKLSATVIFIPHSIAPYEDDRVTGKDIYEKVKNKHKVKVIINDYTAAEIKGIIGQCDLLVGARTHSVINATSMYVPSLLIAGSIHKPGIMTEILDGGKWVCSEPLSFDTLTSRIDELWSERERVKEELKPKVESVKERALLNGELVKELMGSLSLGV